MTPEEMREVIYPEFYGPKGYIARGINISRKQQSTHLVRAERAVSAADKELSLISQAIMEENSEI